MIKIEVSGPDIIAFAVSKKRGKDILIREPI
jgi:hypothetical protein